MTSMRSHALFSGRSFSPSAVPSGPVDRASVNGASDHLPDLRVRQEQVVVDNAPALRRGVDDAQPKPRQLGLFGGADAGDAAAQEARDGQRAVVGSGNDRDLPRERADARDRGGEDVEVDVGRGEDHGPDALARSWLQRVELEEGIPHLTGGIGSMYTVVI